MERHRKRLLCLIMRITTTAKQCFLLFHPRIQPREEEVQMRNKLAFCIAVVLLVTCGCAADIQQEENAVIQTDARVYYTMEDFDALVIGKSTAIDVVDLVGEPASGDAAALGVFEYPTKDGNYIQVKMNFWKVQSIELSEKSYADHMGTVRAVTQEDSIPTLQELQEKYSGKTFTMDDFATLIPGVSTMEDLLEITPDYLCSPFECGMIFQYPERDGGYIYIVCADTVRAIYISSEYEFNTFTFLAMLRDKTLRPEIGRWADAQEL